MSVRQHREPQFNHGLARLSPCDVMSEDELSALAMRGVSSTDIREEIENRCDRAARASARAWRAESSFKRRDH